MKAWEPIKKFESFYTTGKLYTSKDFNYGYSLINATVLCFDLKTSNVISKTGTDVVNYCISDDNEIITYTEDDLITYYQPKNVTWKSNCNVFVMEFHRGLLATGASDNSVRVYQAAQGYLTHKFKHTQHITALTFAVHSLWLVSAGLDNNVKVWDLTKSACIKTFHVEDTIKALKSTEKFLIASTSQQIISWNTKSWEKKTHAEEITSIEINKNIFIGNSSGTITKLSPRSLSIKSHKKISNHAIICIKSVENELIACNEESTVLYLDNKLKVVKEYIGHIDEVLDLKWLSSEKILVALNSTEVKVLTISDSTTQSLKGHTDNVLCIDVQGDYILTGSKDQTIRYWNLADCLCLYKGHTEDVTSIQFSKKSWFVSAGIDRTLKIWKKDVGEINNALYTCVGHAKDISVVRISTDNKTIVSGSQDKLIKVWSNKLKLTKELAGHKRGVWDLSFHNTEKLLCSSSGDMTIKLWDLSTYECIRTLEGSTNSILKCLIIEACIISTTSDGLIKIWDYKAGTCTCTLDTHTGKIWGLAYKHLEESQIVTGGTDSLIILWKDVTSIQEQLQLEEKKQIIQLEHSMQSELRSGHYAEAALIAFKLKRPQSIYNIIQTMSNYEITNFVDGLVETPEGILALLTHIRDWNCFKKYSNMAQKLLFEVFERVPSLQVPEAKEILSGIVCYSNKHYDRAHKLYVDSFLIEHIINEITLVPLNKSNQAEVIQKKQKLGIS
jgi:U3 small nucleolar RNA-associated protein 13